MAPQTHFRPETPGHGCAPSAAPRSTSESGLAGGQVRVFGMTRVTPELDRLTEAARAEFHRNLSRPDAPAAGVPDGMTMGSMLTSKTTASASTCSYLQLDPLAGIAIPRLYRLDRDPLSRSSTEEEIFARAMKDPAVEGLEEAITTDVRTLIRDVDDYLIGMLAAIIREYPDSDVSALLLELWHIHYDEFDPDAPGSEVDYNAEDALPTDCETPHNHLLDLIVDTVTARLMKRNGPELLLAWADATETARR
jgi:hypothetical protein